jgi:hypothetical protein
MDKPENKLSDVFAIINQAKLDLEKLLPELCEVCELPASMCQCEDHC